MTVINMITAVARPYHLPAMLNAIESASAGAAIRPNWILVFDKDKSYPDYVWSFIKHAEKKIGVEVLMYGGPYVRWAVAQRNMGLDQVREGFFFPHDDDNVVHPKFFRRIGEEIQKNPDKKGFICKQVRWDGIGTAFRPHGATELSTDANNVRVGQVDSAMALMHKDLVRDDRYNPDAKEKNDGEFIERVFKKDPAAFVFIPEVLCYYNYLRIDNAQGMASPAYR